ncbi:MAG: hypothetical protein GXO68_04035 [Crenarchaeota archaeon]|nr:hypothetical protein [Thermoproteota archaeon]
MSTGLDEFTTGRKKGTVIYKPIHLLYTRPNSQCEFFSYEEEAGGYIAHCRVLGRPLTKDEAIKCENYWRSCPFRRIGIQMEESGI